MNEAGGDFYDLLRIEGGWMAVIGGQSPAMVPALLR